VAATGAPRLVSLNPPQLTSAVGGAKAEWLIAAWSAFRWVGVPCVWSERGSVAADPVADASPKEVCAVGAANAGSPCL